MNVLVVQQKSFAGYSYSKERHILMFIEQSKRDSTGQSDISYIVGVASKELLVRFHTTLNIPIKRLLN